MKIGDMKHRVTFQEEVKVPDGHKGFTVSWIYKVEVWGSVKPLSSRERFFSDQIKAEVTHKVRVRYLEGVTEAMRIKHRGRVLLIAGIIDIDEKQEELEITCAEEK